MIKSQIDKKLSVYPWAVKVDFFVNERAQFKDFDGNQLSVLWEEDLILELKSQSASKLNSSREGKAYTLIAKATNSAAAAEAIGVKLAYCLLKFCIDKEWGITLSWPDTPYPCRVLDRGVGSQLNISGSVQAINPVDVSAFASGVSCAYTDYDSVPESVLLSMELFAASSFEFNQRTKLIMQVSSLEALAKQKDFSFELDGTIKELLKIVRNNNQIEGGLKSSLCGQIENLKRESIRQALKRLLKEQNMKDSDIKFIEKIYNIRSSIVHDGERIADLQSYNLELSTLLRRLFLGLKLNR